jgi:hypothetical protein
MTNDERVTPIVEEWLEATSVTPPDAEQSVDQVMTDLLRQSQLRPWWPSRILRRRAPEVRRSSMFSAARFVVAVVIVALFGGFLLGGVLTTQQDHEVAPAAATVSPSLVPAPDLSTSSLPNQVQDLAVAPDGTVWAATRGGVVRWEEGASTPVVYGEQDGLPAADVDRVVVAGDGTVWAAGNDWVTFYDQTWQPMKAVTDSEEMETAFDDVIAAHPTGGAWVLGRDGEGSEVIFLIDREGAEQIISLPEGWTPEVEMAVDSAGRLWVVEAFDAHDVFVHDGGGWRQLTTTEPLFGDTFHYLVSNIEIAPDGTVWISTTRDSDPEPEGTPAPGVASSDGQTWTTYTTADGLAADEGTVVVAPDGTVWVVHDDAVSRRDGDTWTAYDVAGSVRRSGAVGGSDGTLWLATDDGIIHFDGVTTTRFVVPADMTPDPLSFSLEPVAPAAPPVDAGSFGEVAWQKFDVPTGHRLTGGIATADGFAANESTSVRTSLDGVDWATTEPPLEGQHLVASGDDLYALGGGVVRLARTGTTWAVVDELTIPDPGPEIRSEPGYLDFAERMAFGDGVTVMTARSRVFFSNDGHTFVPALRSPDPALLEGAREPDVEDYGPAGGCDPSPVAGWGADSIGPVFATESGFVAFTAAHPNDWNNLPLCRPIIWTSSDGSAWDLVSSESPFGPDAYVHAMAERDGRIVAVGGRGHEGAMLWASDDGTTWNEIPPERISGSIASVPWAITAGEAGWVVLCGQPGTDGEVPAMYSLDGLDWVVVDDLPDFHWAWGAPDVAVGTDRILVTYYDGVALIGEITR